jgi:hypothetical protein
MPTLAEILSRTPTHERDEALAALRRERPTVALRIAPGHEPVLPLRVHVSTVPATADERRVAGEQGRSLDGYVLFAGPEPVRMPFDHAVLCLQRHGIGIPRGRESRACLEEVQE